MAFVSFMGWRWPDDAANLLRVSLLDVQAFKAGEEATLQPCEITTHLL